MITFRFNKEQAKTAAMFQLAILMLFIFTILIHCFSPSDVLQRLKAGYLVILNPQNLMPFRLIFLFREKRGVKLSWVGLEIQHNPARFPRLIHHSLNILVACDPTRRFFFPPGDESNGNPAAWSPHEEDTRYHICQTLSPNLVWFIYIYMYICVDSHFWCQVLLFWDFLAVLIPLVTKPSNKNENSWKWKCHKV